ncbi:MAG TPA: DUF2442 domain-containing protein [Thermoguttaceae bacterium]|nr:DUF2442 domain-containing protein [Thermoguttaceae bacterium]HPP51343.1 DUF2442 domain-containing protein [Thermoguttaceae bacterium]
MPRPLEVKPLKNYRIWIKYADGVEGEVDLSELVGKGVFAAWKDDREFQKVHIGSGGEIAWSDQIDLCADAIYLKLTGKKPEDIFPSLHQSARYA